MLMSTGSGCRPITTEYLKSTASSSTFPKVASYHRTAITTDLSTSDNNDKGVEQEEKDKNVLNRSNIAEVIARDFNISMNKADKILISAFDQISEVSSAVTTTRFQCLFRQIFVLHYWLYLSYLSLFPIYLM